MFSFPERVCPEISRKEGRFRRHADLFQLDYLSVFFTRMRPLHRVVLAKLFGKRRKTLWCRGILLSPPIFCHKRHRCYSLPIPRTILTRISMELCNFVICAKPYARLHEIPVHSSLKIETETETEKTRERTKLDEFCTKRQRYIQGEDKLALIKKLLSSFSSKLFLP